jgi:hypothetical protein
MEQLQSGHCLTGRRLQRPFVVRFCDRGCVRCVFRSERGASGMHSRDSCTSKAAARGNKVSRRTHASPPYSQVSDNLRRPELRAWPAICLVHAFSIGAMAVAALRRPAQGASTGTAQRIFASHKGGRWHAVSLPPPSCLLVSVQRQQQHQPQHPSRGGTKVRRRRCVHKQLLRAQGEEEGEEGGGKGGRDARPRAHCYVSSLPLPVCPVVCVCLPMPLFPPSGLCPACGQKFNGPQVSSSSSQQQQTVHSRVHSMRGGSQGQGVQVDEGDVSMGTGLTEEEAQPSGHPCRGLRRGFGSRATPNLSSRLRGGTLSRRTLSDSQLPCTHAI